MLYIILYRWVIYFIRFLAVSKPKIFYLDFPDYTNIAAAASDEQVIRLR